MKNVRAGRIMEGRWYSQRLADPLAGKSSHLSTSGRLGLIYTLGLLPLLPLKAGATTYTYLILSPSPNWSDTRCWVDGVVPLSDRDTVVNIPRGRFGNLTTTHDLGNGFTLNRLVVDGTSWINGDVLNFVTSSTNATPAIVGNGLLFMPNALVLNATPVLTGSMMLSGAITGIGGISVGAGSRVDLGGVNSYSGETLVNGGALGATSAALGSSTVRLTSGSLRASGITNSIVLEGTQPVLMEGEFNGPISLQAAVKELTGLATFAGPVSGAGDLVLGSSFTLSSASNSGYTGNISIRAGATLRTSTIGALGAANAISLEPGATAILPAAGNMELKGFSGSGGTLMLNDAVLTVGADNVSRAFGGLISDTTTGGLIKAGTGTLTLSGESLHHLTTVTGGQITHLGGRTDAGALVQAGAALRYEGTAINPGTRALRAESGATITYAANAIITGGSLTGGGAQIVDSGGAQFTSTTLSIGSKLAVNGPASLTNVTNRGTITANAALTYAGGIQTPSGSIVVNSGAVLSTSEFESSGVITIKAGGTLNNSASPIVLSTGSRTTVAAGATFSTAAGTAIDLLGGSLIVNGSLSGALHVHSGGVAAGSGSFGNVEVMQDGTFSPGTSPGTASVTGMTFAAGSRYVFELNSASATPGAGADFLNSSGILSLEGGTTAGNRITIALTSLQPNNEPGPLSDFQPTQPYTFRLATAEGGIAGFRSDEFAVDVRNFGNELSGGVFTVSQSGNDLLLRFSPIPEPGSLAFLALSGSLLCLRRRTRKF
jgi:autotransporter-associated beta strand protein